MILTPASAADLPEVAALMNLAYRGGGAVQSWCSEAPYVDGERTSAALLAADLAERRDGRLMLSREEGAVVASVWMEPLGEGRWYLGSVAVDPVLQNRGAGRRLLAAAEGWMAEHGARRVRITVVNLRDTLIAWYIRRGYAPTGETEPWPYGDDRFGAPRRSDLCFVVLEKALGECS